MSETPVLDSLRCDKCGDADVAIIAPGTDEVRFAGRLIVAAEPMKATCMKCWLPALYYQQELFA